MATAYKTEDSTQTIRAELRARIDQLDRDFRLLSVGELARRTDAIRGLARTHGLDPASRLASGLSDALARDGRGALVRPYLEGLREAIMCDPEDRRAGEAILAAVGTRLVV